MFIGARLWLCVVTAVTLAGCVPPDDPTRNQGRGNGSDGPVYPKNELEAGVEINGVVWARSNVDAPGTFAAKPTDTGMFYRWGSLTGWSAEDPMVASDDSTTWNTAPVVEEGWVHGNGPCPEGWRVPTRRDFETLCDEVKVTSEWVANSAGTSAGRRFSDNATGNSIFLPASGYRHYTVGELYYAGRYGYYWLAEGNEDSRSSCLEFGRGYVTTSYGNRGQGFPVRCVLDL